jgi:hypothetical protein
MAWLAYLSAISSETDTHGDELEIRVGEREGLALVFFGSSHFEWFFCPSLLVIRKNEQL